MPLDYVLYFKFSIKMLGADKKRVRFFLFIFIIVIFQILMKILLYNLKKMKWPMVEKKKVDVIYELENLKF